MNPYIGITDFTNFSQVIDMQSAMGKAFAGKPPRDLMVGMMMSYKTLKGIPSKWSGVFPTRDQFEDVYSLSQRGILNTLHYADYEDVTKPVDLAQAIGIADAENVLDAVQLDMVWPSMSLIVEIADAEMKVVLQVGRKAMELMGNDPARVAVRIKEYGSAIDCVLFDRSGGLGQPMDAALLRSYILETKSRCPNVMIATAGGLGPDSMHLLAPLVAEFPDISIDAQGKLRRSGNALDPIDWDLARGYIYAAGKIFS